MSCLFIQSMFPSFGQKYGTNSSWSVQIFETHLNRNKETLHLLFIQKKILSRLNLILIPNVHVIYSYLIFLTAVNLLELKIKLKIHRLALIRIKLSKTGVDIVVNFVVPNWNWQIENDPTRDRFRLSAPCELTLGRNWFRLEPQHLFRQ